MGLSNLVHQPSYLHFDSKQPLPTVYTNLYKMTLIKIFVLLTLIIVSTMQLFHRFIFHRINILHLRVYVNKALET
jgi:hypothetical protein